MVVDTGKGRKGQMLLQGTKREQICGKNRTEKRGIAK